MLTSEGCAARRARLWQQVPEQIEWLLIADPRHIYYLSNFLVNPLSFSHGERGLLLLERGGESTLVADNFTVRSGAGKAFVDEEVVQTWYDHRHSVMNRDQALLEAVKRISDRVYGRLGAVEAEWLPLAAFEVLGLDHETHSLRNLECSSRSETDCEPTIDLGSVLRSLRRRKEPDEIELMRQCMRAAEAGHARAREVIKVGITDWDMYREIQAASIAAAGKPAFIYGDFRATNATTPKAGGAPVGYILQSGDLYLLDYSVVIDGYRSDFTNTLSVGSPSDEQMMIFELCAAAMRWGEATLRAGVPAREVFDAVATPLRETGYGDTFTHHAGHGIGLGHPEPPILVPESTDILEAGDVVTLEPGLYVSGIGGVRIEHNYLITETGYERLSDHLISLT